SSPRRCLGKAATAIAKGRASSDTDASGDAASLARIARRVGSDRAPKVASRAPLLLTILLTITEHPERRPDPWLQGLVTETLSKVAVQSAAELWLVKGRPT